MRKIIWKYEVQSQPIYMPMDAKILSVQMQNGRPQIWAMGDTSYDMEARTLVVIGTGQSFDDTNHKYIGTYQDDPFVWHLFEIVK